jgi:hypothetical protein
MEVDYRNPQNLSNASSSMVFRTAGLVKVAVVEKLVEFVRRTGFGILKNHHALPWD